MNAVDVIWRYHQAFLHGLAVTAELVGLAMLIGTVAGICLEAACGILGYVARSIANFIAFCVAAIPALVVLFWLYYPAQALLKVQISPFWTAAFALVLLNTFAVYRISADAIRDFPRQFVASALVSGLSARQILQYIKLPLLLRSSLPRWIDQQVIVLQTSVFASLISVEELFRQAQRANSHEYDVVTVYTAMALIFLVLAGSSMWLAALLRARFERDYSER